MAAGDSIAEIETDKVSQNLLDVLKITLQCVSWPSNCPLHPSRYSAPHASDCNVPQAQRTGRVRTLGTLRSSWSGMAPRTCLLTP